MAKKAAKKIAGKDADQYMLRLPAGLRDRVAKRAAENGRSMNTEIIEAIEKHLDGVDRITEIVQFIEKHRENIELLDNIWGAIIDVEGRVQKLDGEGWGTLMELDHQIQERRRKEESPPA